MNFCVHRVHQCCTLNKLVLLLAFFIATAAAQASDKADAAVYVLNSRDASVSVIDPKTWTEKERIATGKEPHHVYLTPDEKSIIVANASSNSLTFIDPRKAKLQRTIRNIADPYHLRFSPDMQWFVTAANRLNHVDIYRWDAASQTPTLAKRIPTGKTPSHMWIDSKSRLLVVSMQDSNELVGIDLTSQSLKWRVPTGAMPADVYGTADDKFVMVGLTGGHEVQVFALEGETAKPFRRIATGKGAHAFRAWGDGRHVLVSNRTENTISKLDMQTWQVTAKYNAPGGPDCMDISADQQRIYVTSRWAGKLSVINTQTGKLERQVVVGKSPHGVWTLDHAPR